MIAKVRHTSIKSKNIILMLFKKTRIICIKRLYCDYPGKNQLLLFRKEVCTKYNLKDQVQGKKGIVGLNKCARACYYSSLTSIPWNGKTNKNKIIMTLNMIHMKMNTFIIRINKRALNSFKKCKHMLWFVR